VLNKKTGLFSGLSGTQERAALKKFVKHQYMKGEMPFETIR
jgi:hypothetical protein